MHIICNTYLLIYFYIRKREFTGLLTAAAGQNDSMGILNPQQITPTTSLLSQVIAAEHTNNL